MGDGERLGRAVEIRLAGGGVTAQVRPVGDAVQVLLEDSILRERGLDAQRERDLADLAP